MFVMDSAIGWTLDSLFTNDSKAGRTELVKEPIGQGGQLVLNG